MGTNTEDGSRSRTGAEPRHCRTGSTPRVDTTLRLLPGQGGSIDECRHGRVLGVRGDDDGRGQAAGHQRRRDLGGSTQLVAIESVRARGRRGVLRFRLRMVSSRWRGTSSGRFEPEGDDEFFDSERGWFPRGGGGHPPVSTLPHVRDLAGQRNARTEPLGWTSGCWELAWRHSRH